MMIANRRDVVEVKFPSKTAMVVLKLVELENYDTGYLPNLHHQKVQNPN
jgi:hypothetical protein